MAGSIGAMVVGVLLGLACAAARAQDDYIVLPVDTSREKLALFLGDETGKPYRSLERVAGAVAGSGGELRFAMNAGMYEADGSPVGLLVIDGKEIAPLNRRRAGGNFYMKPNGVFALTRSGPRVVATEDYPKIARKVILATQSGPMLVKDGALHPRFDPVSTSRYIRNGVCAVGRTAYFVISRRPVTFHEFGSYFKDVLKCRDALYLDGSISSLWDRELGQLGLGLGLGPIIGVVKEPAAASRPPVTAKPSAPAARR